MNTAMRLVCRTDSRWLVSTTSGYTAYSDQFHRYVPEVRHEWYPGWMEPQSIMDKYTNLVILPEIHVSAREIIRLTATYS